MNGKPSETVASRRRPRMRVIAILVAGLWGCDSYSAITDGLSSADAERFARGKRAAGPCWVCHDITGTGANVGPHLRNLMGREIGSLEGYWFSDGFSASKASWGRRNLDLFLANPQGFIHGTQMVAPPVASAQQRADLIFFLELVTPGD